MNTDVGSKELNYITWLAIYVLKENRSCLELIMMVVVWLMLCVHPAVMFIAYHFFCCG